MKYPKKIFVTQEDAGEDTAYKLVHNTETEALENSEGNTVAEYALVKVRTGKLVPEWQA